MTLLKDATKIAQAAGELILELREKKLTITEKAKNDLVTNADKAAEKLIIKMIKQKYPTHGILAEESANENTLELFTNSKYIWIIDPIDGTTNYAKGLQFYAISIGIFETKAAETSKNFEYLSGELVAGVVHAPALNETYYAEKGKGAYLNGEKIKVSKVKKLSESLTVTGFPPKFKKENLPNFGKMLLSSRAVRRLGAASLDMCYVAKGVFEAYWELGLSPWDIAAGALIVEEAGGKVTDTFGNTLDLFGQDILATNGLVHLETTHELQK